MKSLEYQIEVALSICNNEENARIGFFTSSRQKVDAHIKAFTPRLPMAAVWKVQTRQYHNSEMNSNIYFLTADENLLDKIGGMQFSHIFVNGLENEYKTKPMLMSKLRSAYTYEIEPMGFYDEYGVQRWEDY